MSFFDLLSEAKSPFQNKLNPSSTDGATIQPTASTYNPRELENFWYDFLHKSTEEGLKKYIDELDKIKENLAKEKEEIGICVGNAQKILKEYRSIENFQETLEEKYALYDSLSNSINVYKCLLKLLGIPLIIIIIMLSGLYIHLFFSSDFAIFLEYIKNIVTYISIGTAIALLAALFDSFYLYKKIKEMQNSLNHLQIIVLAMQNAHQHQ